MKKNCMYLSVAFCFSASVAQAETSMMSQYSSFKSNLVNNYDLAYNLNYSVMPQYGSPSGKHTAVQSLFMPSITWTNFQNEYGTGTLNVGYTSVFYNNTNAQDVQNNTGMVTDMNDFNEREQEFASLYYTYQLPKQYNWLTLGAGQYTLYAFDGTDYDNNQQANFINYALSQNGSATYADAGLGAYAQVNAGNWQIITGMQDASNITAPSIRFNHLKDKHYTTFGQIGYNPNIEGLGAGQYSIMLYNQPAVSAQPQTTNGWSINMQQNIGEKWALFGRINGVTGNMVDIKNSYVAGMVYNNPFNRNELDQFGLAYAYNDLNKKAVDEKMYESAEQVIETYYAFGISKWATLTPDLQFYIHPALNKKSEYGTATSLRLSLMF